jgi:hypothetical protein
MITTPSWITIEPFSASAGTYYWKIIRFEFFDMGDPENNGTANAYAWIIDEIGNARQDAVCWQHNGGDFPLRTDLNNGHAEAVIPMTKDSNFDPTHGQVGPYAMDVRGLNAVGSDVVHGMGLIGSRHIQYRTTFQLTQAGVTPTPTPTPTPSGDYVTQAQLTTLCVALGELSDSVSSSLGDIKSKLDEFSAVIESLKSLK